MINRRAGWGLACAILLQLTAVVPSFAQEAVAPAPTPAPPPAPLPAATAAEATQAPAGRYEDANIDRAWLTPTAFTQPVGSWSFNDYELFMVGLTYGVTDDVHLTASTLLPIVEDMPFVGLFGGKAKLVTSGRLHVAAAGTLMVVSAEVSTTGTTGDSSDRETTWLALVGGVASYCLDEGCHSLLSGVLMTGFAEESDNSQLPLTLSGSALYKVSRRIKLLVEVSGAATFGEVNELARGALVGYGLRFCSGELAGDVGFLKPFDSESDEGDDVLPLGMPWITFTYRAL